jgi:hypothetical protein
MAIHNTFLWLSIHGIADGNWSHHMAQGFHLVGGESHELLLSDVSALLEEPLAFHCAAIS